MKKTDQPLTEFEGAVLCEIGDGDVVTAYRVRRAFETSRSQEWSGSAGAVYPAIRRLIERGHIATESDASDGRGTSRLSLTRQGRAALRAWASDVERAVGPGVDPFRTRASEWEGYRPRSGACSSRSWRAPSRSGLRHWRRRSKRKTVGAAPAASWISRFSDRGWRGSGLATTRDAGGNRRR